MRPSPRTLRALALAGIFAGSLPAEAFAGNGSKERTPPLWPASDACLRVVDRSIDPTTHFDYAVAVDDLVPPDITDEVPDSRTHQFFGLCRQRDPRESIPRWITAADVAVAEMYGLVPDGDGGPDTVLETHPEWSTCFTRITPDDGRVPITMAQAANGFTWDTSDAAPGNYVVHGYTWEPWVNLWTGRPGIVQIHDGDPSGLPPAAALVAPRGEQLVYRDSEVEFEGCVTAMPGSTWRVDMLVVPNGELGEWVPYLEPAPVEGESLAFTFTPPQAAWGEPVVYLRVVVEDPEGRVYAAPAYDPLNVQDANDPNCEGGGGFVQDPSCEGGDDGESGESAGQDAGESSDGTGESGRDPSGQDGGEGSCACREGSKGGPGLPGLLGCLLVLRRRRSRRVQRA